MTPQTRKRTPCLPTPWSHLAPLTLRLTPNGPTRLIRDADAPDRHVVSDLLLVLAAIIGATGFALIVGGDRRRPRPDLTERLAPFRPTVVDEAHDWRWCQ